MKIRAYRDDQLSFQIPRDQQKVFIDRFLAEVKKLCDQVLDGDGQDFGSPGALVQKVGDALIKQIRSLSSDEAGSAGSKPSALH